MIPRLPGLPSKTTAPKRVAAAIPAWLPQALAVVALSATIVTFSLFKGERAAFRRRKAMRVSDWAERHRNLHSSSQKGRWRNVFTPYLKGIMDAAGYPSVDTVIVCKSPQAGGTEAAHNIVGYCIDRAPGPVMYVFPDEITARENMRERIIPMIQSSPRLSEYLTGKTDDTSSMGVRLAHMLISLAWSGSPSRLGNKPIRTLVLDELDKYKDAKNEATSEALAEERTTTWEHRGRLILKISTPTVKGGPIDRAMTKEANTVFDYWVRCPHCNHWQLMSFDRIRWPEGERNPETVLAHRLAEYHCENAMCPVTAWDDSLRDAAVRRGEWRDRSTGLELTAYLDTYKPLKVGFQIPAWISYFVSLSKVAWAFLKWKESGSLEDFKRFKNQYCGEPWEEEFVQREENAILSLCDDRPRGRVPTPETFDEAGIRRPPIAALLATADTQDKYFRYVIRAYAYGPTMENWLVQCGSVTSFAALEKLFWGSSYRDGNGNEHRVFGAMIDAMGTRTRQVYLWAAKNRGRVFPSQGVQHLTVPVQLSPIEYYTNSKGDKVKIPGGIVLYRLDSTYYKNDLAYSLQVNPDDPGAFHLHSNDKGELGQYASEMCAEIYDDEKKCWVNPKDRPNHFWDCEYLQRAFSDHLGIRNWIAPQEVQQARPAPQTHRPRVRSAADLIGNLRR